ncbi:ABC transporter permease [Alsobacter soli]|uniref:ABC transporter permease n=1 Tax=Alsobacter soli TaxID=2109933 RepID=A0A2T1HQB0_9HYPH|nr:amino acid ABC transporter permease [Alsobacter soli]PSC03833.1 ABC transporter permease [Alsobacter soli]
MSYTFQFGEVLRYWPLLVQGAINTLVFSVIAMVAGLAIGVVGASCRISSSRVLRAIAGAYVEVVRNTPLLVQLFLFYFGLPALGLRLSTSQAAILALTFNTGAYSTEIVRAGIESIHRSQIEASTSLGISRLQTFLHVVLPQGLERVYPALASQFVLMMLASSVVSAIGAEELTAYGNRIQSENFRAMEVFFVCAAVYLGLTYLMRVLLAAVAYVAFPRRRALGSV